MPRTYFLAIALLAATALAQPTPSPHLGDLRLFAGTWQCKGTTFATPWGPEHPTVATIHVQWVLGRYWLHVEYAEKKTARNPHPAAGHVYWGYDEGEKKHVGYFVNNFGGHERIESEGWNADTIVWTGRMSAGGSPIATRDTFVRKSATEVAHKTEAEMNGNWMTLDAETCKKTSP